MYTTYCGLRTKRHRHAINFEDAFKQVRTHALPHKRNLQQENHMRIARLIMELRCHLLLLFFNDFGLRNSRNNSKKRHDEIRVQRSFF